ncbi:MAG: sigma-70 family RNA polymerase sigma factor [Planctomycetota bacterium]
MALDPRTPDLSELLAESSWLQRLSRSLVRSDADADDLAQETWLAAVRGGEGVASARGWLARVARRGASRQRRSAERRALHEELATPEVGPLPTPEEAAERLELARALAGALQEVPEPYRRTLYLHYYQGVAPAAIAQAEGAPAGTVRWRLAHGRSLLRGALQRSDGRTWNDWAVALMPLTGWSGVAPVTGAAATLTTILAMKTTLLGALAGALAAGGSWIAADHSAAAGPDRVTDTLGRVVRDATPDADLARPMTAPVTGVTSRTASVTSGVDPDFGVIGHGRITDEAGEPLKRARVQLVASPLESTYAYSDEGGGWSAMELAPGEYEMTVSSPGSLTLRERVTVPEGSAWRRDVTLARAMTLPVRFETANGEAVRPELGAHENFLGVAATTAPPPATMDVGGRIMIRSECGRFNSRSERSTPADLDARYHGELLLTAAPPLHVSLVYRNTVLETRVLSGGEEELVFEIPPLAELGGSVRVRVVDRETGAPITEGVGLGHPSGGVIVRSRIDGDAVVFENVPPGEMEVDRRYGEFEALQHGVEVLPGQEVDLGTIAIGRAEAFRVRTVDEEGNPVDAVPQAVRPDLAAGPLDLDLRIGGSRGPDGTMEVSWLAPGRTLVRAGGRDGLARVGVEVDTRETKDVELVVPKGVRVALDGVELGAEDALLVLDARGVQLTESRSLPFVPLLAPGAHFAVLLRDSREVWRKPFDVGNEERLVSLGGR